jgi:hypothetical protein
MSDQKLSEFVQETWVRVTAELGTDVDLVPPFPEFLDDHQAEEKRRAGQCLEPWSTLSAQVVLWLSHLHLALGERLPAPPSPRALWALTGFATTQAVAIRTLALCGLDAQARSLVRTFDLPLKTCDR